MLKGAMGFKTVFGLVLGMMVLGTMGAAITTGSLGDVIRQGFTDVGHFTDYTTEIDASNEQEGKETFSDLAMFVRDRSVGCEEVEERNNGIPIDGPSDDPRSNSDAEGYPGLEETRLGLRPVCTGGSSTFIRDRWSWVPGRGLLGGGPEDNVMPGTLSRENFEITEGNLHFEQPEYGEYHRADVWLENNIAAVSDQTPEEHINPEFTLCQPGAGQCQLNQNEEDAYDGTGRNYVVFFEEPDIAEQRTQEGGLLSDWSYDDRVWRTDGNDRTDEGFWEDSDLKEYQHELQLCEGDEGYIQINRDVPMNTGTADESGAENYYPMIVITDTEQDGCGDNDLGQAEEYSGPLKANQLFIKTGSGSGDDYDWPHTDNFEFKEFGSRQGANWVREYDDINEDGELCETYYHERNYGIHNRDGATLRTYDIDTRISRIISSFRQADGLYFEEQAHRHDDNTQDGERDAYGLFNAIADSGGLDERELSDPDGSGELRPNTANSGENELYGDLLCAGDESSDRAQWRLCHEDLDEELRSIERPNGEWVCTANSGVWQFEVEGVGP